MEKDIKGEHTEKPWGSYITFTTNTPSTVKLLIVKAGEAFSLQSHANRKEFWKVLKGTPIVTVDDMTKTAGEGEEFVVDVGMNHRIETPAGAVDSEILEISIGDFDEKDIVRLKDKYGRA